MTLAARIEAARRLVFGQLVVAAAAGDRTPDGRAHVRHLRAILRMLGETPSPSPAAGGVEGP